MALDLWRRLSDLTFDICKHALNPNPIIYPHHHKVAMATSNAGRSPIEQICQPSKLFENMRTHNLSATSRSITPVDTQLHLPRAPYPISDEPHTSSNPVEQSWHTTDEQQHTHDENTWDPDASGYHTEAMPESNGYFQTQDSPVSVCVCVCLHLYFCERLFVC